MAKFLAERSNGRITLNVFSGGDFETEQESLDQTRSGALESALASRAICKELEQEAIKKVTRSGATIFEDVNKESFKRVMLPVHTRFVTAASQKELLRLIQQTK